MSTLHPVTTMDSEDGYGPGPSGLDMMLASHVGDSTIIGTNSESTGDTDSVTVAYSPGDSFLHLQDRDWVWINHNPIGEDMPNIVDSFSSFSNFPPSDSPVDTSEPVNSFTMFTKLGEQFQSDVSTNLDRVDSETGSTMVQSPPSRPWRSCPELPRSREPHNTGVSGRFSALRL